MLQIYKCELRKASTVYPWEVKVLTDPWSSGMRHSKICISDAGIVSTRPATEDNSENKRLLLCTACCKLQFRHIVQEA